MPCSACLPFLKPWFLPILSCWLVGCKSLQPADFAATQPPFDILRFYTGQTRSTGYLESRGGGPLKRVATATWGHREAGELRMTQDVSFDGGPAQRRTWQLRRVDEHHYEATSPNVIGVARGEAWGNTLRLDYVLALSPGNPLSRVRMTHWMMLQPDGRTMLNAVTVKKWGVVVARITEVFEQTSTQPSTAE